MHSIKSIAPLHRHLCPTFAKLAPARPLSTLSLPRPLLQPKLTDSVKVKNPLHQLTTPLTRTSATNMSTFSNTDTGSKPADPYKQKNLENNASLRDKVEDLIQFIDSCKFGMMTTKAQSGLLVSRCMALAGKVTLTPSSPQSLPWIFGIGIGKKRTSEESINCKLQQKADPHLPSRVQESGGLDLIFHTNTESGKTDDLHSDPAINIAFLNSSGEWASISGEAAIITDRDVVRKHYSRHLKAWIGDLGDGKHDGGPEDPRIGIIKVNAKTATYAVADRSAVARGFEVAKGMVTGEAPNVQKLRELNTDEIQQCKSHRHFSSFVPFFLLVPPSPSQNVTNQLSRHFTIFQPNTTPPFLDEYATYSD